MLGLTKKDLHFLKNYYPYLSVRKNHVIYEEQEKAEIPSSLYPVQNKTTLRVFSFTNTEQKESIYANKDLQKIIQVFNECEFKIGHCYSNTETIIDALKKKGIYDITSYVGWVFLAGSGLPVHHCWAVYKENFVLDPGITKIDDEMRIRMNNGEFSTPDEYRKTYTELHVNYKDVPNFEKSTFGQVAPFAIYVGTESKPSQGSKLFRQLTNDYPNHPAYQSSGMNAHGASTTQLLVDQALKK